MNKLFTVLILCAFFTVSQAQVVINKYAAVNDYLPCGNTFQVDDATGFGVGDTVLVIQMKGASIDSNNSPSFGAILNYNGAGNYEFNVVSAVAGTKVTLRYNLMRSYDIPVGKVQLVRVPYYQNYTVSQPMSCMPWNGNKGGIVVLNAAGTITLNAPIDVSFKGFRNGNLVYVANGAAPCAKLDYYYANVTNSWGAEKGEGITTLSSNRDHGRGPQANGGGGGNSSNGGGGGGGNAGAGGLGGKETAVTYCAPAQHTGGLGGIALSYSNTLNKVFMGGGSGAGHANNANGGNGSPGGGIVLLMANQLIGNGQLIKADGGDGVGCAGDCWDGQPGGSAAGSILLHVSSFSGALSVSAKGGKGASHGANNTAQGANGPGGGGGGGALWVKGSSIPSQITATLTGGARGVFTNNNDPWGTTDGQAGISLSGLAIGFPTDTFTGNGLNISFKDSVTGCLSRVMVILTPAGTPGMIYSWNFGGGNTSTLREPTYTFPAFGTYTVTLTIDDGNGCTGTISKTITILPQLGSKKDTTICTGGSVLLSAYGGSGFSWTPATGLSNPTGSSTMAQPSVTTTYIVTVTAGSCTHNDTFVVNVVPPPKANFISYPTTPVPNTPIKFTDISGAGLSRHWDFGDGTGSEIANPVHLYKKSGNYRVCLMVSNGACEDSVCKIVEAVVHLNVAVPSAFTPNGDGNNDVLMVRGSGVETVNLVIYNRWGQKVFESFSLDDGWDGTFNGKMQEIDIYAYVLRATFFDGSSTIKKGNTNLLR